MRHWLQFLPVDSAICWVDWQILQPSNQHWIRCQKLFIADSDTLPAFLGGLEPKYEVGPAEYSLSKQNVATLAPLKSWFSNADYTVGYTLTEIIKLFICITHFLCRHSCSTSCCRFLFENHKSIIPIAIGIFLSNLWNQSVLSSLNWLFKLVVDSTTNRNHWCLSFSQLPVTR